MKHSDDIIICHNPNCGTSRNVLAMIKASGAEPIVVEYLETGWGRKNLELLLEKIGCSARDILRVKGTKAQELGLTHPDCDDSKIFEAMLDDPILVNRPIVLKGDIAKLCRPSEAVMALLDDFPESFTKEDGEVIYRKDFI